MMTLADVERVAEASFDPATWAYVAGGAGAERSVAANRAAFDAVWLQPAVLGSAARRADTTVTLFGQALSMPVILGPTSPQRICHDDAELATAEAAHDRGTVSVVSTDGHHDFRDVAAVAGKSCWFQVYAYDRPAAVDALIAMAEDAGATGIVLTVDASHRPERHSTRRARFALPPGVDFGTLRGAGLLEGAVPADARLDRTPLTWADVERIRLRTTLPLVIKGVLRPADAQHCVDVGADGIVVSNHGGRQLDGVVPALAALPRIAERVGGACTVLMDGGVRTGGDVVKALALGATAVCIARPYLWGLRLAGRQGVETVLDLLRREIEDAVLQLGLASVTEVTRECVTSAAVAGTTSATDLTGASR